MSRRVVIETITGVVVTAACLFALLVEAGVARSAWSAARAGVADVLHIRLDAGRV